VADLRGLPLKEQRAVACVHLLTALLDGEFTRMEITTFEELAFSAPEVVEAAGLRRSARPACQVIDSSTTSAGLRRRLRDLAYRYRNRHYITAKDLAAALHSQVCCPPARAPRRGARAVSEPRECRAGSRRRSRAAVSSRSAGTG
jgi:hypothetical protein